MSKFKKIIVMAATFIVIGAFAKTYNTSNHERMALEECVSEENIKRVDEVGFECIKEMEN
ncbi:MAG: hypothetical protein ACI9O6_003319 [Glaciecola sp.]|jgi:hypothetical protein